jgi:hypothetical protein
MPHQPPGRAGIKYVPAIVPFGGGLILGVVISSSIAFLGSSFVAWVWHRLLNAVFFAVLGVGYVLLMLARDGYFTR